MDESLITLVLHEAVVELIGMVRHISPWHQFIGISSLPLSTFALRDWYFFQRRPQTFYCCLLL